MDKGRPVHEAENRLERLTADRATILAEVERRVFDRLLAAAARAPEQSLEYVLNDVAYCELRRLEAPGAGKGAERWRDLSRRLRGMSEADKQRELRALISHYGHDVVGNFDPRVYKFATGVGPSLMGFLLSPIGSVREGLSAMRTLEQRVQVDGALDVVRTCAERGTLVVTPTHSSNMDSPAIGFALLRAGLPPVTYGAGKNLFSNPFISFFMRNLGAYRVDRRLRFELYKDVLKEYSTVLLERGYHSLFFPGGTRCRSNMIEKHLKLGLLGTTVTAYKHHVAAGNPGKRIYIVPATINYRIVLEAETLIADFLAEAGKNRYIIDDDEFSRLGRIVDFFRKILALEGSVIVRLGRPLDPFGNEVDDDGESRDRAGRLVDPASYVRGADGQVTDDDQRDAEYTRTVGRRLAAAYPRLTVFHATSLLARVLYDRAAAGAGTRDVYRLLRAPASVLAGSLVDVLSDLDALRAELAAQPDAGSEHPLVAGMSSTELVDDALRALASYHSKAAVERRGDQLVITDLNVLYYYQNRTAHLVRRAGRAGAGGAS
ncbi:MAG: 1-acyl-sn-glycerol-3-phosphate acyltransferase [Kofleriaceae bacterium]|nr:1-acyl-sn-glycerol-3-phosphate acyltransferase [Kofleriaceae bacterium]MBP6837352.1 1-acyl-sn-glycerol-3-phosphate acyltransferase [Kofleriaceae bacterium]MBP9208098.1 1-acyl-sn-glycerol-3-phosphate acyltransferase [Kofleriaceae bacterium]